METGWAGHLYLFVGTVMILLITGVSPKLTSRDQIVSQATWWRGLRVSESSRLGGDAVWTTAHVIV